jgi:integrase
MTKNRYSRKLQFSDDLENHLKDMHARRAPDSEWIFPSPKRGSNENHKYWANPHKPWEAARIAAELPNLTRHCLRHYFASNAVMAGVDTMTVSKWLGHQDGGRLVEKLYGNKIPQSHMQSMARMLTLSGPRIVALPTPEPATEAAAATA